MFGVGQTSDHGIQDMNWKNLAPRLGVAYQLNPKTVIRAGYGWSYSLGTFGTIFGHNVTQNLPVLANQQINAPNGFTSVFSLAQGPTALVIPAVNTTTGTLPLPIGVVGKVRPADVRLPRAEAYNLTIQRQVTERLAVSVGYVGNVGRHAFNLPSGQLINANQPAFVPGVSNSNTLRPYYAKFGWTQDINYYCDCANTRYDALQAQATLRNFAGATVQFNYTYQREIGDNGDSYTFLYNRPLGYGNSDSLSHQLITVAENWDIPFGKGKKYGNGMSRGLDIALGGWAINGVTTYTSGRAFTPNIGNAGVLVGVSGVPAGYTGARPNQGPGGRPDAGTKDPSDVGGATGDRNHFFGGIFNVPGDPKSGLSGAFGVPADNTFGNIGYNTLFGPKFIQQDMSLAKRFSFWHEGKIHAELRAEAFNVFNHTNLGDPNNDITSPQVGQITGLVGAFGTMRRFQYAIRFDF